MRPVGPGSLAPDELLQTLGDIFTDLSEAQVPTKPRRLVPVPEADLPPAADWPGCIVYVSDLGKVGLSDGVTWTDAIGGAL